MWHSQSRSEKHVAKCRPACEAPQVPGANSKTSVVQQTFDSEGMVLRRLMLIGIIRFFDRSSHAHARIRVYDMRLRPHAL